MPISDGYETCEKIIQLFNKNNMFSHEKSIILAGEDEPINLDFKNRNLNGFK